MWVCDLRVFLDRGREMREGPTLLKERRYLRKDATEQMRECFRARSGLAPVLELAEERSSACLLAPGATERKRSSLS